MYKQQKQYFFRQQPYAMKEIFRKVKATCNVKKAEKGIYRMLTTCTLDIAGKGFRKVQAIRNAKKQ